MNKYKRLTISTAIAVFLLFPILWQGCILVVEEDDEHRRRGFHGSEWYLEVVFYRMETFTPGDRQIDVTFTEDKLISGKTSCGAFRGVYTVDEFDNMNVESLVSDNGSCDNESTSAVFLDQLRAASAFEFDEDHLKIRSKDSDYLKFDRQ